MLRPSQKSAATQKANARGNDIFLTAVFCKTVCFVHDLGGGKLLDSWANILAIFSSIVVVVVVAW
jgi:hypothetical protein